MFTDLANERDQIWAEAVVRFKEGEQLYMGEDLLPAVEQMQEEHTYRSVKEDLVRDYLDRKLPSDWKDMSTMSRVAWLDDQTNEGTETRDRVCLLEIWCELFGGNKTNFTNVEQRELKSIMDHIGWEKGASPRQSGPGYGKQRCYIRPGNGMGKYWKQWKR